MEAVLYWPLALSMGPALKCSLYTHCHSTKENGILARGGTLCPLPLLCARIFFLSDLSSCRLCVCVMSVSEFLLEAAFYRPHARSYTVTLTQ